MKTGTAKQKSVLCFFSGADAVTPAKMGRTPAFGRFFCLPIVVLLMLSLSARASTLYGYSGTISASAHVESDSDSENPSIDGFGDYTATADVQSPYGIGTAHAGATAALDSDGFVAEIKASAGRMSGADAGSCGALTLDFFVADASTWSFIIDAAGNYSMDLFAVGENEPLYTLQSDGWPGDFFEGAVPLVLEAGPHRLELTGSHFASTAGVIESGHLSVTAVPVPATMCLVTSALGVLLLGGRFRKGSEGSF